MSFIKDTLEGLALIAIIFIIVIIYRLYRTIGNEDSKRGEIARKIGNISWGTFLAFMIVCSFVIPLIVFMIWLCS